MAERWLVERVEVHELKDGDRVLVDTFPCAVREEDGIVVLDYAETGKQAVVFPIRDDFAPHDDILKIVEAEG